ncbi:hypothetical protein QLS71_016290 [Mariniflexile litorale]|uniref:Uncharacterized protein n=1 Tax=Mariniflexile litorale TaxID=3045158 RepID=A0AAU7ECP4_9FLAO|nr:hypothetical protein [Mariniflexile sp. KMM 9835]MDQ8212295.1 hypothetical protein [Mariniflexile sp. KMM 9835]
MKKDKKESQFEPQISKEDSILSGERPADTQKEQDANELLKKRKGEPDTAADNLDIPGASHARPLTNDRHSEKKKESESLKNNLDTWNSENSDKK